MEPHPGVAHVSQHLRPPQTEDWELGEKEQVQM